MASISLNQAAWLTSAKAHPLEISPAPMPVPKADQLLIKIHSIAINPADHIIQTRDILIKSYPVVIGCDFSGTIVSVGTTANDVYSGRGQKFEPGDRVIGSCDEMNVEGMGAFQLYTIADTRLCAKLPPNVAFSDGCVLPLGLSTAASSLFQEQNLGLQLPGKDGGVSEGVVLIWGGSSSVGSCAVQMCKAVGLTVATTASKSNEGYCKELGADFVFDHRSESVVEDIVSALRGKQFAGSFAAVSTADTIIKCGEIVSKLEGRKFVATVMPPGFPLPEERAQGVEYGFNWSVYIKKGEIGEVLWGGWVTQAMKSGQLKCLPGKKVVGKGLESVQLALDEYGRGVSAKKLVVEYE